MTQWFIHKDNNTWLNAIDPANNNSSVIAIRGGTPYIAYSARGTISTGTNIGGADIVVLKLGADINVPSNSFCARLGGSGSGSGPLITVGETTFVYTGETIDALVADTTLPSTTTASWASPSMPAGTLLRDLGRYKVVRNAAGANLYTFRNVQLVSGAGSEGVSGSLSDSDAYKTGWVCVWSAAGFAPII